jgi:hypothetical protein
MTTVITRNVAGQTTTSKPEAGAASPRLSLQVSR